MHQIAFVPTVITMEAATHQIVFVLFVIIMAEAMLQIALVLNAELMEINFRESQPTT